MTEQEATQTAQPTAGEWRADIRADHASIYAGDDPHEIAYLDSSEANAQLIVAACNAAMRLNPLNPLAAAQNMERVATALEECAGVSSLDPPVTLAAATKRLAHIKDTAETALDAMGQDGAG